MGAAAKVYLRVRKAAELEALTRKLWDVDHWAFAVADSTPAGAGQQVSVRGGQSADGARHLLRAEHGALHRLRRVRGRPRAGRLDVERRAVERSALQVRPRPEARDGAARAPRRRAGGRDRRHAARRIPARPRAEPLRPRRPRARGFERAKRAGRSRPRAAAGRPSTGARPRPPTSPRRSRTFSTDASSNRGSNPSTTRSSCPSRRCSTASSARG